MHNSNATTRCGCCKSQLSGINLLPLLQPLRLRNHRKLFARAQVPGSGPVLLPGCRISCRQRNENIARLYEWRDVSCQRTAQSGIGTGLTHAPEPYARFMTVPEVAHDGRSEQHVAPPTSVISVKTRADNARTQIWLLV